MFRFGLGALLLFAFGCGGTAPPKTYPTSGSVVYAGGQPLKGGSIQFDSTEDPLLRVIGAIEPDGKFTLTTVKDNTRTEGAPAGDYKVTIQPPAGGTVAGGAPAGHKAVPAITLSKTYRVEADQNNTFKIELTTGPPGP